MTEKNPGDRAKPQRVGGVPCSLCHKPATRHAPPPNTIPLCDHCSTFDTRSLVVVLISLTAATPALIPLAWAVSITLLILALPIYLRGGMGALTDPQPFRGMAR